MAKPTTNQKKNSIFQSSCKAEIKQFSNRYPARQVPTDIESDVMLTGDALLLKLLVSNLLENANKYSEKQKPIAVELQNEGGKPILKVMDEGIGIADSEKEAIFQKFYRIGNEQTRTTKGTGLGLYICRQIAEAHGAVIEVADHLPQGSKFIVQFTTPH